MCEFVDTSQMVDIHKAIREKDILAVFKGICQMRKLSIKNQNLLMEAAAFGNGSICLLVGLNTDDINALDDGGWSALSYAAYYGRKEAAQALLLLGCNPKASTQGHPYVIANSTGNETLATLFVAYWTGAVPPHDPFTPRLHFDVIPSPKPR